MISTIQAGDYIYYSGTSVLTISSSSTFPLSLTGVSPTATAVIDFGTSKSVWDPSRVSSGYVKCDYTGTGGFNSMKIANCSNLRFYGGDFTASSVGTGGIGIWGTSHDLLWYDPYIHDIGGSGVSILNNTTSGASGSISNVTVRAEVNRFCMRPSFDPHIDKGCGIHGCIIHGGNVGSGYSNLTAAIYAHDPLRPGETSAGQTWPEGGGGAAIEPGNDVGIQDNFTLYALAENMLMTPNGTNPGSAVNGETAGNAIELWGSTPLNGMVIGWAEANNCTGGCVHEAAGNWKSASPTVTVLHGRHSNANQYYNTSTSTNRNVAYDNTYSGAVIYQDCT